MKCFDTVSLSFKEIKLGYKLLIPAFIATALIMAAAIIILNISESSIEVIYAKFTGFMKNGISVTVENAGFEDIETLKSLGVSHIGVWPMDLETDNITLKDENGTELDSLYEMLWIDDDTELTDDLKSLNLTTDFNTGNKAYLLVSDEIYDERKDIKNIVLYGTDGKEKIRFDAVIIRLNSRYADDVYLPYQRVCDVYKNDGVELSTDVYFEIKDMKEYTTMSQKLLENGFTVNSAIDDLRDTTAMISAVFKALAIIVICLGIACLVTMCNMYFNSRIKHIVLQKTLGMTSGHIFAILFLVIEVVLAAAVLAAMGIVFFGNNYIHSALFDVFGDFSYSAYNTFSAALFAFIVANIAAFVASLGIYVKIKRADMVSLLGKNE